MKDRDERVELGSAIKKSLFRLGKKLARKAFKEGVSSMHLDKHEEKQEGMAQAESESEVKVEVEDSGKMQPAERPKRGEARHPAVPLVGARYEDLLSGLSSQFDEQIKSVDRMYEESMRMLDQREREERERIIKARQEIEACFSDKVIDVEFEERRQAKEALFKRQREEIEKENQETEEFLCQIDKLLER